MKRKLNISISIKIISIYAYTTDHSCIFLYVLFGERLTITEDR